jgi:hypothetical protein
MQLEDVSSNMIITALEKDRELVFDKPRELELNVATHIRW